MADEADIQDGLARCEDCGQTYPVRVWPDGTVRPIGRADCQCGGATFRVVEESDLFDDE